MTTKKRQLIFILAALCLVLVADQTSKAIIMAKIPPGSVSWAGKSHTFFWFTHERNEGLVGGTFRHTPAVAYALSLGATLVLIYLYRHLNAVSRVQAIAYGMVAGGAAGNLIDRMRLGSVTDFLQFNFYFIPFDIPWKQYPAFNIADSSICIGVALLVLTWHHMEKSVESNATHPV